MSEFDGFRVEHDAERGVATITLDVPGKFNRVSMLARDQLAGLFADLDRDDAVRFVVLTGAGGQFTAGGAAAFGCYIALVGRHRRIPDEVAVGRVPAREERRRA